MTHTPGNWRIQSANDDYTRYQIEVEGWGIIMHVEDTSNESEANARGIIAFPYLLAALEYIVNWDADTWNPLMARDLANAAIAKAKGE